MKPIYALALIPLVGGCHFDKLFRTGDRRPPLSHGTPVGLAFNGGPGPARAGQPLDPVRVAVVDSAGTAIAGADSAISIELGANPGGATLTGTDTVHAVNGVATFTSLQIDKAATGYTLKASSGLLVAESDRFDVMPPPTTTGDLTVTTTTTGANLDADGYTVTANGTDQPIPSNGSTTFTGLPSGNQSVTLSGVASNCSVTGGNTHTASVPAGGAGSTSFAITCVKPPPTTGDLTVTTTTGGTGSDPNGYTLSVDGATQPIAMNDTRTITGLLAGDHSVGLLDVASTCVVSGQNPRTVNVPAGSASQTNFTITCTAPANLPPVAAFTPSCNFLDCSFTSTSSDPDGTIVSYAWTFGDGGTSPAQNPSHTYGRTGDYTVTLTVKDNQNATNSISLSVHVEAPPPPNQSPVVSAGTNPQIVLLSALFSLEGASFSDPDNGPWNVTIDWGDGSQDVFPMASAGSINRTHSYPLTVLGRDYQLRVTVEDARAAQGSATKTVRVVVGL